MFKILFKYFILAVIIAAVIKYVPNLQTDNKTLITYVVLGVLLAYVTEKFILNNVENMDGGLTQYYKETLRPRPILDGINSCYNNVKYPNPYTLTNPEQDRVLSGIQFDNDKPKYPLLQQGEFEEIFPDTENVKKILRDQSYNADLSMPGYYLINNGKYAENGIPFEKIQDAIKASKFNDLYNQHNHHIKWSPHTHLGKARGYMNWLQNYM